MKILIISQNTYPLQTPRAFRTAELSEQLAKMGHEVRLYTIHGGYDYAEYVARTGVQMFNIKTRFIPNSNKGITRYNFFDRVLNKLFHRLFFFPQIELAFMVPKILEENPDCDTLITIAYPHSIHLGAAWAKEKYPAIFPKKWVADCGDPFFLNPFFNVPKYMKRYEEKWCETCDYITVPTEESKHGYFERYWDKIVTIPQGFDFSKTPIEEYCGNEVPTFVFAGAVYPKNRDPHSFMDYLLKYSKPYKFKMYMRTPLEERYIAESNGQIEYIIGKTRAEIIKECSKADFLINIINPNKVQTPSKLIDYGIAARPILDISSQFTEQEVFEDFMAGNYCGQHVVENLDGFKIESVAKQILML